MDNRQTKNEDMISRIGDSLLFKLGTIGFLTLLLLIPSEGIRDLIRGAAKPTA